MTDPRPTTTTPPPLAYEEVRDDAWAATVSEAGWCQSGEGTAATYRLETRCPHCKHPIILFRTTIVPELRLRPWERLFGLLGKRGDTQTVLPPRVPAHCTCQSVHPPQAAGGGCGRYGAVRFKDNINDPKECGGG